MPSADTDPVCTTVIIFLRQDFSRNGIVLNGQSIKKTSVILVNGDILELPNMLCKINALWMEFH
jgi:hypothetical protein